MAAVDIILYQFDKAENSTMVPTADTPSITMQGRPREPFSVTAPVFGVQGADVGIINYDFAYIPDFGRYYHINNWTFAGGLWHATLSVDVLASYRDQIRSSSQYVTRSADEFDGNITDSVYPTMANGYYTIRNLNTETGYSWTADLDQGMYVVGVINGAEEAVGVTSYYAFTNFQFRRLCTYILANPAYLQIDLEELSEGLQKALVNPFEYITSVNWFPFSVAHGQIQTPLKFGWYEFQTSAYKLSDDGYTRFDLRFTIPKHPQALTRGGYLNREPYSSYALFVPGFGDVAIPSGYIQDASELRVEITVDSITGVGTLRAFDGSVPVITQQGQIGIPIQIAAQTSRLDMYTIGANIANELSQARWANNLGLADAFRLAGIGMGSMSMNALSTQGSNGTLSAYIYEPMLTGVFSQVVPDDNTHRGRPLCQRKTLSTLSGYTMVADPHITFGLESEQTQIKSYMRGGFYLE